MIIDNSFASFIYNIQQSSRHTQPPANPAIKTSPVDSNQQRQNTQPTLRKDSNLDALGQGKLL